MSRRERFNEICNDAFRSLDVVEDAIRELKLLAFELHNEVVLLERKLEKHPLLPRRMELIGLERRQPKTD